MLENLILAEKYRPKTIEECILPVAIKKPLLEMIETGNVSHCLLSGSPGTGKTTAVRALVNQLNGELLFINASLENGIDVIRTKVMQYSSTVSLEDKPKFLLFDEFDGISCFKGDQKVKVVGNDGEVSHIPISELANSGEEYNFITVSSAGVFITKGWAFSRGTKEVFEYEFDDGSKVYCTDDHRYFDENWDEVTLDENIFVQNI